KSISAALQGHLAGEVTTLATCWKLTRTDSTVLGFTDHTEHLLFESVNYLASAGFTPSAVHTSADLAVDNLELEGVLDADAIAEEDVMAGLYDFAEIEIFMVNYADLSQGALKLRRGNLGEVTLKGGQFVAEVRGLAQRLSQTLGALYSPLCRAKLGDGRCGVDMGSHTETGSVTSVTSNQIFVDTARTEADGYFDFGKVTFTSGDNEGLSMEVKQFSSGRITLVLPMPYAIGIGDDYSIEAGCDKTLGTCIGRFSNAVNFRGEPHVPGIDRMLETAGTRSEW
ncbi:MAG: DUF2163 domain-containing protein, partial [Alphaproteobacteria bacterium]|nr:DUF2163 domain-containing protein [Alphaproteobacteria bacterium]